MKKIMLIVLCASATLIAHAQDNSRTRTGVKNSIRVSLLSPFENELALSYERAIAPKLSFNFNLAGSYEKEDLLFGGEFKAYGIMLEADARYYLSKKSTALKGWFVSAGALGAYIRVNEINGAVFSSPSFDSHILGASVKTGYQFVLKKRLTFGGSIGADYRYDIKNSVSHNFRGRIDLTIGYSW